MKTDAAKQLLCAAVLLWASGHCLAQGTNLEPFVKGCGEIADTRKRLACYDSLSDRPANAPAPPRAAPERPAANPERPRPAGAVPAAAAPAGEQPIDCRSELQCWGERNMPAANSYCKDRIDNLATDAVRWTDGLAETRFSRLRWLDKSRGILTFIGDKAEFRGAGGTWQQQRYECDFDPQDNRVVGARAQPGKVP